jgi:hypothetical protein
MTMDRRTTVETICELLAGGKALAEICRRKGMPTSRTFLRWADEDPHIAVEYRVALEARAEWFNAEHERIRKTAVDRDTALAARVQLNALEWQMAKMAPKKYGDRVDVKVQQEWSLAAEIEAARMRALGQSHAPEPVEIRLLEYAPENDLNTL